MRVERQCVSCGTLISEQVADELHCPTCGAKQDTNGTVNPYASPQAKLHSEEVPSEDPDSPRSRALQRMRIPVLACRVILVVSLLIGVFGTVFVPYQVLFGDRVRIEEELGVIGALAYPLAIALSLVGLYGLGRAAKLDHLVWAWIGVVISGAVGIAFWIVLPFVIWAAVVLCGRDARAAFRSARRAPE